MHQNHVGTFNSINKGHKLLLIYLTKVAETFVNTCYCLNLKRKVPIKFNKNLENSKQLSSSLTFQGNRSEETISIFVTVMNLITKTFIQHLFLKMFDY